jgi:DNA-binding NtrC family response regulator
MLLRTEDGTWEEDAPRSDRHGSRVLLVCVDAKATIHPLPRRGSTVVGRSRGCGVTIDHPSVSRHHVKLEVGEQVTIEELGSRNGTRIDGRPLAVGERAVVTRNTVIELGSARVTVFPAPVRARPSAGDSGIRAVPMGFSHVTLGERPCAPERVLEVLAPSDIGVLLLGETGVGKEVFAELIHRTSQRRDRPMIKINCAALPEALLEGELFGFERGAFTGALTSKPGLFEAADKGTIFLDEVGEIAPATQAKLLRVLETGEVTRLGSVTPRVLDVRVISATNRDLKRAMADGSFRSDLFFRLNGVTVRLPPLRERREQVGVIADELLRKAAARKGGLCASITPSARAALERYDWPGNVRELKNVLDRAALLASSGRIDLEDLGLAMEMDASAPSLSQSLSSSMAADPPTPLPFLAPSFSVPADRPSAPEAEPFTDLRTERLAVERRRIADTLELCGGNQSRAAKVLGIGRRTLIEKMEHFCMPRPRKKASVNPA